MQHDVAALQRSKNSKQRTTASNYDQKAANNTPPQASKDQKTASNNQKTTSNTPLQASYDRKQQIALPDKNTNWYITGRSLK